MTRVPDAYAIDVDGVGKYYPMARRKTALMSQSLWRSLADPFRLVTGRVRDADPDGFWALRDVSLRIQQGESVGIIGANGSGKTTLLKLLARVTAPTTGTIRLRGRVTPLLGVGTGFVKDLSGRANIYLNASILGMTRREIDGCFDEIVDFAGVGRFIDMPVKAYSSGMYARLAFSVAVHITTDVLLVDEILSVGDASFRGKSMQKMTSLMRSGGTVVFVSHAMDAVTQFCQKAVWMEQGRIAAYGPTDEVVARYLSSVTDLSSGWRAPMVSSPTDEAASTQGPRADVITAEAIGVELVDETGRERTVFMRNQPLIVRFRYRITDDLLPVVPVVHVHCETRHGVSEPVHVLTTTDDETAGVTPPPGDYLSELTIPPGLLNEGEYSFGIALASPGAKIVRHFKADRVLRCRLLETAETAPSLGHVTRGVVRPRLPWQTRRIAGGLSVVRRATL
jgi:lipopolysaccharide transport system ATP-binding protein